MPQHCYVLLFSFWEKSAFSYQIIPLEKGEYIWSGFQATESHCKHPVPQSIWQCMALLTQLEEGPRWEKGKGYFSLQSTIGAVVLSLNGVSFVSRLLPSCFVSFMRLILGVNCPSITMYCFSRFRTRANFPTILGLFSTENMFGVGFKPLNPSENSLCPQSFCQGSSSICLVVREAQVGKMQWLLFIANHDKDCFSYIEWSLLCKQKASSLLFCVICDGAFIGQALLYAAFLNLENEHIYLLNQASSERNTCLECVSSY